MAKLFEYAVVYAPKETQDAQGNDTTPKSVVLTDVTTILASSDREVSIVAARAIPDSYLDRLDQIEVVIRPFA